MAVRPVRKCLVARSRALSSRNCSMDKSLRVLTTFSSWMVKSAIPMVSVTSPSRESGTGGRCSDEPKPAS